MWWRAYQYLKKHDEILGYTSKDEVLQLLKEVILTGWPADKKSPPAVLNLYYSYRDELPMCDRLIFRWEHLVISHALRYQTIKQLHSSHLEINGCLRRARKCLFWPSMSAEIKEHITQREICSQHSAKQAKETLITHEPTDRPWEKVASAILTTRIVSLLWTICPISGKLTGSEIPKHPHVYESWRVTLQEMAFLMW